MAAGPPNPTMKLDPRHLINGRSFEGKKINSVVINKQWLNQSQLNQFFQEAVSIVQKMGKTEKDVTLSNGSVWNVNINNGHFYPVSSPDGSIVNLTKSEMEAFQAAVNSGAKGEELLRTLAKSLYKGGKGYLRAYQLSANMKAAIESFADVEGISQALAVKSLAESIPAEPTSKEFATAASKFVGTKAWKYVKWGGRALLVVAVASDTYEVYNSENKTRTIAKKVASLSSAAAGAQAGAQAGAEIGAYFEGWGAIPGALIGGAVGYYAGETITEIAYDWIFKPATK